MDRQRVILLGAAVVVSLIVLSFASAMRGSNGEASTRDGVVITDDRDQPDQQQGPRTVNVAPGPLGPQDPEARPPASDLDSNPDPNGAAPPGHEDFVVVNE